MAKEKIRNGKIVDRAGGFSLIDTGVGTYAIMPGIHKLAKTLERPW